MRGRACLSCAVLATTLAAQPAMSGDALAWPQGGVGIETTLHQGGTWTPTDGKVYATDPLALLQATGTPQAVPARPAAVLGLLETELGRTATMLLQWSESDVVCGVDLGTNGVHTGLVAFLTAEIVTALEQYGRAHGGHLYAGPYAEQLDRTMPTVPFIVELPDGTRVPLSGSGWDDGGYPVASLLDAEGEMLALYMQFIGGGDWLMPEPCPQITG